MQHEPLARAVIDAEVPVLPHDVASVDAEARAVGLSDHERLEAGLSRAAFRRASCYGADPVVHEVDDAVVVHVECHDDAFDRPVVGVRQLAAVERERPQSRVPGAADDGASPGAQTSTYTSSGSMPRSRIACLKGAYA
jgi:hypothetical protein